MNGSTGKEPPQDGRRRRWAGSRPSGPGPRLAALAVIIPVHDEEELLAGCLASVHRALDHPDLRGVRSTVVLVLDACSDDSARIARHGRRPTDGVIEVDARNVGAARALGCEHGLTTLDRDADRVWLATTDADTRVPPHWLTRQLALATEASAVAGVVRVDDWSTHSPTTRRRFERSYRTSPFRPHPHVHGANLGVRAAAYLDVGGFPALSCAEDHALWSALRAAGHPTTASRRVWVTTSARRSARATGGFADTLLDIERAG